jgi:hypothetical protein
VPPLMRWADHTTLWGALRLWTGAFAVPGGDTARQDALNVAFVEVSDGLRGQAKLLQPPEVEEALFGFF